MISINKLIISNRLERKQIVVWRRPVQTLQYCILEVFYQLYECVQHLWYDKKSVESIFLHRYYRKNSTTEFEYLQIDGCPINGYCSLDQFYQRSIMFIPVNWAEECAVGRTILNSVYSTKLIHWKMKRTLSTFLFLLVGYCFLTIRPAEELVLLHAVWRHGDRTPTHTIPTYVNNTESTWPQGLGELTTMGMRQEFDLAIDIWMIACMGFIFLSLLELAAVAFNEKLTEIRLRRRNSNNNAPKATVNEALSALDVLEKTLLSSTRATKTAYFKASRKPIKTPTGVKIDKTASICFPLAFLCFNVIYWVYYLQ